MGVSFEFPNTIHGDRHALGGPDPIPGFTDGTFSGGGGGSGTVTQVNGVNPDVSGHVVLSAADVGAVPTARTVSAGTGLGGGGALSGNITLSITDNELLALMALTAAADKLPYFSGPSSAALATFTAFARTLLDDPDQATALATLGAMAAALFPASLASGDENKGLRVNATHTGYELGNRHASAGLPDYAPFSLTKPYDPRGVYGFTNALLTPWRAKLGAARAGLATCHWLHLGDSLSAGYFGTDATKPNDPAHSWVNMARDAMLASGVPWGGTGWVPPSQNLLYYQAGDNADPRWTFDDPTTTAWAPSTAYTTGQIRKAPNGTDVISNSNRTSGATFNSTEAANWTPVWDRHKYGFYAQCSTVGKTATFESPYGGCTNVDFIIDNAFANSTYVVYNSAGASIASGSIGTVGGSTIAKVQLSGLVDAKKIVFTAVSGNNRVYPVNIYKASGLQVHNFSIVSALMTSASGFENNSNVYNFLDKIALLCLPNVDMLSICGGGNDLFNSIPIATIVAAMPNVFAKWGSNAACKVFLGHSQAASWTDAQMKSFQAAYWQMCETNGYGYINIWEYWGTYTIANSAGVMQDSGGGQTHPNQGPSVMLGSLWAELMDCPGATNTLPRTLIENAQSVYPARPIGLPPGGAFYAGPDAPTTQLTGDHWTDE